MANAKDARDKKLQDSKVRLRKVSQDGSKFEEGVDVFVVQFRLFICQFFHRRVSLNLDEFYVIADRCVIRSPHSDI